MKRKYEVYYSDDKLKTNLEVMTKKERLQYVRISNLKGYPICECGCKLKMTKDGRFIDDCRSETSHKKDCSRYKGIVNSITSKTILIDPFPFIPPTKTTRTGENRWGGGQSTRYNQYTTFLINKLLDLYNDRSKYSISQKLGSLYQRLNTTKEFKIKVLKNCNVFHFVGLLSNFINIGNNTVRIEFLKGNGKTHSRLVSKYEFDESKSLFKDLYKTELTMDMHLLVSIINLKSDDKVVNIIRYIPVTNNLMPCDSFLEQKLFNIIENELSSTKDIILERSLKSVCYKDNSLEDGIIRRTDNGSNKVVIEVFGMHTEDYLKKMNEKIKYIKSRNNLCLLDLYDIDSEENCITKLHKALNFLKS